MASNPKCSFFTCLFSFFLLSSSALDMSIITYDNENNTTLPARTEAEVLALYESWLVKHDKAYNAIGEKERRFEIFKDNLKFIDEHNSEDHSYKVGLNNFADLTNEEFQTMHLQTPRTNPKNRRLSGRKMSSSWFNWQDAKDEEVPDSIDWREKGAVGPVRNQGSRGFGNFGWAFSAIAALESKVQIETGNMLSLSVQQLIDCSDDNSVEGAYEHVIETDGVFTEDSYPYYYGPPGNCKQKDKIYIGAKLDGYAIFKDGFEMLQKAVAYQPVSTPILTGSRSFQLYKSGIYTNLKCGTSFQQQVTVVGYNLTQSIKHYIAENSWGTNWGEQGFIKLGATPDPNDPHRDLYPCNFGFSKKAMPVFLFVPPSSLPPPSS